MVGVNVTRTRSYTECFLWLCCLLKGDNLTVCSVQPATTKASVVAVSQRLSLRELSETVCDDYCHKPFFVVLMTLALCKVTGGQTSESGIFGFFFLVIWVS